MLSFVILQALIADLIITPILLNLVKTKGFVSLVEILSFDIQEEVYKESDFFNGIDPVIAKKMILNGKVIDISFGDFIAHKYLNKNLYLLLEGRTVAIKEAQRGADRPRAGRADRHLQGALQGRHRHEPLCRHAGPAGGRRAGGAHRGHLRQDQIQVRLPRKRKGHRGPPGRLPSRKALPPLQALRLRPEQADDPDGLMRTWALLGDTLCMMMIMRLELGGRDKRKMRHARATYSL